MNDTAIYPTNISHQTKTPNERATTVECPVCGVLNSLGIVQSWLGRRSTSGEQIWWNHFFCANETCRVFVAVRIRPDGSSEAIWPRPRVSFQAANVPPAIADSINEAIDCYAVGCFRASALMFRRALEEICEDHGISSKGRSLKSRIDDLKSEVLLPSKFLDGLHNLRLLGNDAAHIELKSFDQISEREVEAATKVVIRLIENIYQIDDLTDELNALKKEPTS